MVTPSQSPEREFAQQSLSVLEVETFGSGGLAHYVHNLSQALVARGHRVTLLTAAGYELAGAVATRSSPDSRDTSPEEPSPPASVNVVPRLTRWTARARLPRLLWLRALLRKVEALADVWTTAFVAVRLRPDVVHLHCTNPIALLHATLLRAVGQRLVCTAHVVTPHEALFLQSVIYRGIHRLAVLVIAHSEFDRQRLIDEFAVAAHRIAVIPHGEYGFFERSGEPPTRESSRRRLGLEPHHEVALFFGYLREYKGLDVLLDAWPDVARERPEARLVVVGDPVQLPAGRRRELADRAERLGAIARFEYVPFAEVAGYFAAADLLVMPYRRVSQSGVLYLGLSLGLPVVATRIGAWSELLTHEQDALLVTPDSPLDLARAMQRLFAEPDLAQRLAEGGRGIAEKHSWGSIAVQTERAFRSTALRQGPAASSG